MKKLSFFVASIMLIQVAFAGGILTNTNQSAQFIRMLSRNASADIDGVYFNPAGLVKMEDGWHFAFHSQTIFQDKTIDTKFSLLNDGYYVGKVNVPVFPSAFAVYKKDNWAFSFGFGPNAGGGSADFDNGLPSFEIPISKVAPALSGLAQINESWDVTGYDADLSFTGTSVYWGIQLGATYKINEKFSVYGGIRYLPSKNVYEGSIKNIQLEVAGQYYKASDWLSATATTVSGLASTASAASTNLSNTATQLQAYIDAGAGSYTLAQLEGAGQITASTREAIEGGLTNLGVSQEQIAAMDMAQIQGTYSTAATTYGEQAAVLAGTATTLEETSGQLGDKEVDTKQTGNGFTPIFGLQFSPTDNLDIAIKYEMKTALNLTNDTEVDDFGMFADGEETENDIPGILGVGIGYRPFDWLETQFSYTGYFNKAVDWGFNTRYLTDGEQVHRDVDKNGYELGLGLQFNLNEKFAISTGTLYGNMGVANIYQSDFSYSNPCFTIGGGLMWKITDKLVFDAGISNSYYEDQTITFTDSDYGSYIETLGKTTLTLAAGISYSIF